MATYSHLPLHRVEGQLLKRKNNFPGNNIDKDAAKHGAALKNEVKETQEEFQKLPAIEGIDPALILKIKVIGLIADDEWRKLGLSILSIEGDKTTVLFADDKTLAAFHQKVDAYKGPVPDGQKNPSFAALFDAIEEVSLVQPVDRIGRTLRIDGVNNLSDFSPEEEFTLDFELHKPRTDEEAILFVYRLETVIKKAGGYVVSSYLGNQVILVRVTCSGKGIVEALYLPEVAVVEFPPQPDLRTDDISQLNLPDIKAGKSPSDDALTIGIIDSGVNFGHELLAPTEAGAFSVLEGLDSHDQAGHGTSVASIAAFGDISERVKQNDFDAQFWIASACVTTADGVFPKEMSVPEIMERSVRTLVNDYGCRIINISLGDAKRVYDGSRVDLWSGTLDILARELDILIIVSAGNRNDLTATYNDGILKSYPKLLLDPASRLVSPAIGVNLLSVGSIAHSNGLDEEDAELVGIQPICDSEEPSPFTRCGPGVADMLKPDLVDFGGSAVWDGPTQSLAQGGQKPSAGIWTFHHKPIDQPFRSRSGTSFSAPNVAYKAALLLAEFPKASANLLRCLLAISARTPRALLQRDDALKERDLLPIYGNGVPNAIEAASSDDDRVILFVEDKLKLDHFAVFEVPIPAEFQTTKGEKEIKVSLAFDPPTRHTRADYLGVTMGWRLLRGTSEADVFDRFRKWEADEGKPPEFENKYVCSANIGSQLRERGTLQTGSYVGKADISEYGDRYYVAVWCSRRWAPKELEEQRFALAVQLRHKNVSTLYQKVKNPVKVKVNA